MNEKALGRLERLDLRTVWTSEAADFTPWLARPENLAVLAETLVMDLEVEAQEKRVGPFRADLLCKNLADEHWVLIENQLERTDHAHLGQLLTYAAGLQAVTIVWIAESFTEEHRATLDWLNKITDESFQFFGLEVELWRIGASAAAPKFNIVSKPNDWSRSVAVATRAIDDSELTEVRVQQREYWKALNEVLTTTSGPVGGNKKPQPSSWMSYSVGRSGFWLAAVMLRHTNQVRAELYISGVDAKAYFWLLHEQKSAIEKELGYELIWEELPENRDSRISIWLETADPEDQSDWSRQHAWLAQRLNGMHKAFTTRVKDLVADGWSGTIRAA